MGAVAALMCPDLNIRSLTLSMKRLISNMADAASRKAVAEATVASKSLASLRLRPKPGEASLDHPRRGCAAKPTWSGDLRTGRDIKGISLAPANYPSMPTKTLPTPANSTCIRSPVVIGNCRVNDPLMMISPG